MSGFSPSAEHFSDSPCALLASVSQEGLGTGSSTLSAIHAGPLASHFFLFPLRSCGRGHLIVGVVCISQVSKEVSHFLMNLFAISRSSFVRNLFKYFAPLKLELFSYLSCEIIYFGCRFSVRSIILYSSQFMAFLFVFLTVSFEEPIYLILIKSVLSFFLYSFLL